MMARRTPLVTDEGDHRHSEITSAVSDQSAARLD